MTASPTRPPQPDARAGRLSIRRRLLAVLLAVFALGVGSLYLMVRGYAQQTADTTYDQILRASALSMSDSIQLVGEEWRMDMPYAALALLAQAPRDRVFYRVQASDGTLISGYPDLPAPPSTSNDSAQLFEATYQGEPVRFAWMARRIAGPGGTQSAVIQVGQTRLARDTLSEHMLWRGTLALALFTVAALALAYWGLRRSLAPIQRIERELAARGASDLQPISAPVPEELATLVHTLDGFMGRLAENLDTLRLFIAEAAHQLRTPMAALHAQMEVALDEEDPVQQRRSLLAVLRNAEKLSRLVNQLLSDASVIHRSSLRQFEPVDLAELLRQAAYDSTPQADPEPDVRLALPREDEPARALADSLMLREAFKNLIDNALRHGAAPDGHIDVRLQREGDAWRITVSDQGPGIPPAVANTAFERFVRGPNPRGAGAGLGLAIVRRVVDSHHGSLCLSNRPGGGLDAVVVLPVHEDTP
ncbi:bifunctional protein two-component system sensor protein and solute-binding protein [Bordetella ansorpii]|uniref:histidine kinase n=1 Tax=Bordetella ansorpii TaxID=288768 RepID=A0A157NIQ3_9BORD|nr:sensor histidine kinase [Bordetella ansorpii]SAI21088.1 bifunctional protein two-component system sensor protein and solute-binding protein [Bordetella ansorpii]